jgi:hypothetical protein
MGEAIAVASTKKKFGSFHANGHPAFCCEALPGDGHYELLAEVEGGELAEASMSWEEDLNDDDEHSSGDEDDDSYDDDDD